MSRLRSQLLLLLAAVGALACRRESAPATDVGLPSPASPPSVVTSSIVVRREGLVSVEPEPACNVATAGDPGVKAPRTEVWFTHPPTQPQRREAIEKELENWKASVAGTFLDDERRAFTVVLHSDFADYDALRQKLEPLSSPLKVVLRPACYSRAQIEEARQVLLDKSWHAEASKARIVYYFDARFSAFSVGLPGASVALSHALEQRLGKLVRIAPSASPREVTR